MSNHTKNEPFDCTKQSKILPVNQLVKNLKTIFLLGKPTNSQPKSFSY